MRQYFRDYPQSIERLFRGAGFTSFPEVAAIELTECHARSALTVRAEEGDEFVLIFETLREPSVERLRGWGRCLTDVYHRREVPVLLVVICNDHDTAEWASRPIEVGTDFWASCEIRPLVLGPHNVALPEGPVSEADLGSTLLGVIAHGRDPRVVGVLEALAATLYELDEATRVRLAVEFQAALVEPVAARTWRNLMGFITVDLDVLRAHPVVGEVIRAAEARARARGVAR
jgi:hypothetical protein